ncbi:MAG TPA: ABC transporter ATP-binding protein [Bacteroidia bacterium]|jgi:Cu-processing system ATP-binding protein|nr:ABC transporter ATP-binding protein [Bacteroidia bacterium]HQF28982.1 ABC transporter ATP-binding protein [Bacteroidia bacterium]HQK98066.1 ABC transporter ATP-binding protein [Bacteroidia bacterium]
MISIENISKSFGKQEVLKNISVKMNSNECIALIGPNGSGKTTLIKSVLGMVPVVKGKILIDNVSIEGNYQYRSLIGYMPQIGRYPDNMNIGQVINLMKNIRGNQTSFDETLIDDFNLRAIYGKKMSTLSGGTRQKVSACIAFLFNPHVLILDEPTAGLDPLSSEILKNKILVEKAKGKLIIITSHVLSELEDLITRVIYMQDGNIRIDAFLNDLLLQTGENKLGKIISKALN